jgi:hypothetical protein
MPNVDRLTVTGNTDRGHLNLTPMAEPAGSNSGGVYMGTDGKLHVHDGTVWYQLAEGYDTYTLTEMIPATAQGTTANFAAFRVPVAGTVTSVSYVPVSAITGADTNTRKVLLLEANGVAGLAELQFNSGVNASSFVEKEITIVGSASALQVDAGQILRWRSLTVGTGMADPGGLVIVTITPS